MDSCVNNVLPQQVLETDYDTQKALAPYLKIPALRNIIHTFTNDENGNIGKWACNPEVQRLFSEAKKMLDNGRLSEQDLQTRLTTYLEVKCRFPHRKV